MKLVLKIKDIKRYPIFYDYSIITEDLNYPFYYYDISLAINYNHFWKEIE